MLKKILSTLIFGAALFISFNFISINFANAESLLNESNSTNNNFITPFANVQGAGGGYEAKVIYLDKYIKKQGYLTNSQLKDYVRQVKNRAAGYPF